MRCDGLQRVFRTEFFLVPRLAVGMWPKKDISIASQLEKTNLFSSHGTVQLEQSWGVAGVL